MREKFIDALNGIYDQGEEFIDSLNTEQFKKVMGFFNTMPKLRHVVKVENPKTKVKSEVVLEGIKSFLV